MHDLGDPEAVDEHQDGPYKPACSQVLIQLMTYLVTYIRNGFFEVDLIVQFCFYRVSVTPFLCHCKWFAIMMRYEMQAVRHGHRGHEPEKGKSVYLVVYPFFICA